MPDMVGDSGGRKALEGKEREQEGDPVALRARDLRRRLLKWIAVLCLFLVLALGVLLFRAQESKRPLVIKGDPGVLKKGPSGPEIEKPLVFDSQDLDLGPIESEALVNMEFTFRNQGREPVEITEVRSGCGCTVLGVWTRKVAPGERGSIPLQLNTRGQQGTLNKPVDVLTNAPGQRRIELRFRGQVVQPLWIAPWPAAMGEVKTPDQARLVLTIVNGLDKPLKIEAATLDSPLFSFLLKTETPEKKYTVEIRAREPLRRGFQRAELLLKIIHDKPKDLVIPVSYHFPSPVKLTPPSIALPVLPLPRQIHEKIYITHDMDTSLVIEGLQGAGGGMEVALEEVTEGKVFLLKVSFPKGFQPAPGQALNISFRTNHPACPRVEVPIVVRAR